MSKITPSPEQIARVLASIPEGFIKHAVFTQRFRIHQKGRRSLNAAIRAGRVGEIGSLIYDAARLNAEMAQEAAVWCEPSLPPIDEDGSVRTPPVIERRAIRQMVFEPDPSAAALFERFAERGYAERERFSITPQEEAALSHLLSVGALAHKDAYVYDPLRLSESTLDAIIRRRTLLPLHQELVAYLNAQPGRTASIRDVQSRYGSALYELLAIGGVVRYPVGSPAQVWMRTEEAAAAEAEAAALNAIHRQEIEDRKRVDAAWAALLPVVGDVLRPGADDGTSNMARVLARSYSLDAAARRLAVHGDVLKQAIREGILTPFADPKGKRRIAAAQVEAAHEDPAVSEAVAASEQVTLRGIALVSGLSEMAVRHRLTRANIDTTTPTWGEVRGKWGLPERLRDYRELHKQRKREWLAEQERRREEMLEQARREEEEERRRRTRLREQLIAIFPNWERARRAEQEVILHIGPTNSGKTHDALNHLIEAGSGWYLAPLRLLAFEVFDRLNARGVHCNLLTGEEYIPVPGAQFTAATIEMFNPMHSGDCVIIDEAHMFADPDRGAAWTRALMEAQAQEIHVLGAPIVRPLIQQLTQAVSLPLHVIEHRRLTPLHVADAPWTLHDLPPRTILVAFSRKTVLGLKVDLERAGRTVSVVYGNLPPEVRRRQADRFANEECEICIATDAVGMGLNLPADQVCFYEMEKFDGKDVRLLEPHEVQQIGGRAGRHGLSEGGVVGVLSDDHLRQLRALFDATPPSLTHAHVAPTVEAISLIPGTLAQRLREWALLESIPEALRASLKTADMSERIELAAMLRVEEVEQLGMAAALKLINAPTRQETRDFWRTCATAILRGEHLPSPSQPPTEIRTHRDLDDTELCILEADVYLWLAGRQEFSRYAGDETEVRATRIEWSLRLDDALLRKIDTTRRCVQCGTKLPTGYRFALCDNCFHARRSRHARERWR